MDHHFGPPLLGERGRRFGEARVEETARRRRRQPERMLGIRLLDHVPMVGQPRHRRGNGAVRARERDFRPVRLEAELAVRVAEAVEIVRRSEIRLAIDPAVGFDVGQCAPAGLLQRDVDQLARRHGEARVLGAEPLGQRADHVVVRSAFAGRLDQLRPEQDVLAAAGQIEVVVLDEHGGGQHDIGGARGVGHELLVHADEQIVAGKAALDRLLIGGDGDRIGVLGEAAPSPAARRAARPRRR